MRRYHCERCGARFTAPYTVVTRENLDGEDGWWERIDAYCPNCGRDRIEQITDELSREAET